MIPSAPRFVWGIAYNMLNLDETAKTLSPSTVSILKRAQGRPFTEQERKIIYHDPAVRLKPSQVENIRQCPVYDTHRRRKIGELREVIVEPGSQRVRVLAAITDPDVFPRIDKKELFSFSVGYEFSTTPEFDVQDVTFKELSLCVEPFFNGCTVEVAASKKNIYNGLRRLLSLVSPVAHHRHSFSLMASSSSKGANTPATTASAGDGNTVPQVPAISPLLSKNSVSESAAAAGKSGLSDRGEDAGQEDASSQQEKTKSDTSTPINLRELAEQNEQLHKRLAELESRLSDKEFKEIAPKIDSTLTAITSLIGEDDAEFLPIVQDLIKSAMSDVEFAPTLGKLFEKISVETRNLSDALTVLEKEKNTANERGQGLEKEVATLKSQLVQTQQQLEQATTRTGGVKRGEGSNSSSEKPTQYPRASAIFKPVISSGKISSKTSFERLKLLSNGGKHTDDSSRGEKRKGMSGSEDIEAAEPVHKRARATMIPVEGSAAESVKNHFVETLLGMSMDLTNPLRYDSKPAKPSWT